LLVERTAVFFLTCNKISILYFIWSDPSVGLYEHPFYEFLIRVVQISVCFSIYELLCLANRSLSPVPVLECHRFSNLLKCAECHGILEHSAQNQHHRSVSHCHRSFVVRFALPLTIHFLTD